MAEAGASSARLEELQRRWAADRGSRVFLQLAEEYRRLGRSEDAVEVLQEGLTKRPDDVSAQVAMARCLLELGEAERAMVMLRRVVDRDPTHLVAAKLLVEAHLARGDAVQARRALEAYRQLDQPDPEIEQLEERIEDQLLADAGEPGEPPDQVGPAPEATPHDGRTLQLPADDEPFGDLAPPADTDGSARALAAEGIFSFATAPAARAPRSSAPQRLRAASAAGPLVMEVGRAPADRSGSDEPPATVTLGQLYLDQGHLDRAERIFETVLARDPDHPAAMAGLEEVATRRDQGSREAAPEPASEPEAATEDDGGTAAEVAPPEPSSEPASEPSAEAGPQSASDEGEPADPAPSAGESAADQRAAALPLTARRLLADRQGEADADPRIALLKSYRRLLGTQGARPDVS